MANMQPIQAAFELFKEDVKACFKKFVPIKRKINGHELSTDITLDAEDVGADPAGSAANVKTELTVYIDNKEYKPEYNVEILSQEEFDKIPNPEDTKTIYLIPIKKE